MKSKLRGFDYYLDRRRLKEYKAMPIEKRLTWLYQANVFRKSYPKEIIELQDKFREGKI